MSRTTVRRFVAACALGSAAAMTGAVTGKHDNVRTNRETRGLRERRSVDGAPGAVRWGNCRVISQHLSEIKGAVPGLARQAGTQELYSIMTGRAR